MCQYIETGVCAREKCNNHGDLYKPKYKKAKEVYCSEKCSDGFYCTRKSGHKKEHEANVNGKAVARWKV